MGKSSKPTVGFWYHVAYHAGLGIGPIDAFLEFRAGDRTAWSGELTSSGTIYINAPNLFGGEKDQGGIVGPVDVMFGEGAQTPNDYLLRIFGSQVPAWRGLATLAFKGGRYGAMNPYPQKPAYKFRKIKAGWDNEVWGTGCWYPEKSEIVLEASTSLAIDAGGWDYQILPNQPDPAHHYLAVPTDGWLLDGQGPFAGGTATGNTLWPTQTVLWVRRNINVPRSGQQLKVWGDNGFVVLLDGAVIGIANPQNLNPVGDSSVTLQLPSGTHTLAIKGYDEEGTAGGTILRAEISSGGLAAINPAHILYYARTHSDLGREPVANINDASFRAGADWFYNNGVGLCTDYDPTAESVDDFIARISRVAGCGIERSPVDGRWYLDIINGVYDLASLPILTDDDILAFSESPSVMDSAANSVSVKYFDPQTKEDVTTAPVQALALVDAFGTIHQELSYPEIPTGDLALRIAERDLRNGVTPTRAFELTCTRKPYSWRRNTYFRLQSPKRGIAEMVCMLAASQTGTLKSGAIKITAAQDIYSLPSVSFVDVEPGVDTRPSPIPLAIINQLAFEAPYTEVVQRLTRADLAVLPSDVGYLMAAATDPSISGGSRDFTLAVSIDSGSSYTDTADGRFCASALVVEGDTLSGSAPATDFTLTDGLSLDDVVVGQAAIWGDEWCRVDAIDAAAGTLTLGRGCADTVPQPQAVNSRIWFYAVGAAEDHTEYTDGETVDVTLLTNTTSQQLDPSLALPMTLTFGQRQARPYPPGNLTINGMRYPDAADGPLVLAWSHRDRVLQADQLLDTLQTDVGPEPGVTYTVAVYLDGVIDSTTTGITGNTLTPTVTGDGTVRVDITAQRDALDSWQALQATFLYTAGESRVTQSGAARITEFGELRITEP